MRKHPAHGVHSCFDIIYMPGVDETRVEDGKGPIIPDQGRLALGVGKAIPRHWWSERVPGQYVIAYAGGDFDCRFPNSPLKKASLTGFHATAKHIAAKAVSPSSETMRTI